MGFSFFIVSFTNLPLGGGCKKIQNAIKKILTISKETTSTNPCGRYWTGGDYNKALSETRERDGERTAIK
jgi:hypothetical protein